MNYFSINNGALVRWTTVTSLEGLPSPIPIKHPCRVISHPNRPRSGVPVILPLVLEVSSHGHPVSNKGTSSDTSLTVFLSLSLAKTGDRMTRRPSTRRSLFSCCLNLYLRGRERYRSVVRILFTNVPGQGHSVSSRFCRPNHRFSVMHY